MMFGHFFEICTIHEKMPKELSGVLLLTYDEICSAVAQALVFLQNHIFLKYVGVFFVCLFALHKMQKSVLNDNKLYDAKFCTWSRGKLLCSLAMQLPKIYNGVQEFLKQRKEVSLSPGIMYITVSRTPPVY